MGKILILVVRLIGLAVVFGMAIATGPSGGGGAQLVVSVGVIGSWVLVSSLMDLFLAPASGLMARRAIYVSVDAFVVAYSAGSIGMPLPAMIATFAGYLFIITVVWGLLAGGMSAVAAVLGMAQLAVTSAGTGLRPMVMVGGAGLLGLLTGLSWQVCLKILRKGAEAAGAPGNDPTATAAAPGSLRELDELRKRLAMISEQLEQVSQERDRALESVSELEGQLAAHMFKSAPRPVPASAAESGSPGSVPGPGSEAAPSSAG